MASHPFHEDDLPTLSGQKEAFDPGRPENKTVYALHNHLALEIVDFLAEARIPFSFHGGTALHSKLDLRLRHSTDIDLETTDARLIHETLREFARKYTKSEVMLNEPPKPMRVEGVRHLVTFPRSADEKHKVPRVVMVEVAEVKHLPEESESLALRADGFTWPRKCMGPSLEGFFAQKLVTLGPRTVGKPVGPGVRFARQNEGVCKQLFDLNQLLRLGLDWKRIVAEYPREVHKANEHRRTNHTVTQVVEDASGLLRNLQMPERAGRDDNPISHALWSGLDSTWRYILPAAKWSESVFRTGAGVVNRVLQNIENPEDEWRTLARPLTEKKVPDAITSALDAAKGSGAAWVPEHAFGGDLMVMWAWSPREFW